MTLTQDSIDRFRSSMSVRGNSESTVRAYNSDLRGLLAFQATMPPLAMVEETAAQYLTRNRMTWAPRTTRRRLAAFRAWAKWAGMPTFLGDYRPPDPGKPRPHPIPEGNPAIALLLDACERNMQSRALIALCGMMGLRVGEAIAVRPDDFDTVENTLTVRGKGDKRRTIPVPARAWDELRLAIAGARLGDGSTLVTLKDRAARARITALGAKAGLTVDLKSHDLRATAATHLYAVTKDLRVVQEILGHADSKTTEVYTDIDMDTMRDAMEKAGVA